MKVLFKRFFSVLYIIVFFIVLYFSNAVNCSLIASKENYQSHNTPYKDDLSFFRNDLPKLHPNLFYKFDKTTYYKKLDYLSKRQSKYSIDEMRLQLMNLTSEIEDGHTSAYVKATKYFPFSATWFDDNSLRITAVPRDSKKYLGNKILKINNIQIDTVINKLDLITPKESSSWLQSKSAKNLRNYDLLKILKIVNNDDLTLTLQDFSNNTVYVTFKAVSKNTFKKTVFLDLLYSPKNLPVRPKNSNKNYWHAYDNENKIFYFRYKSCMDAATAKSNGEAESSYLTNLNSYFDKLIKDFNDTDAEKFILDLRDNSGGNPALIKYLIKNLSINSKFIDMADKNNRLFIFTNESTFSAGVFAAIDFKKSFSNAKIIGTSTGGLKTAFSNPKIKVLKDTNMYLSYATDIYPNNSDIDRSALNPDIESPVNLKDALTGIDYDYKLVKDSNIN